MVGTTLKSAGDFGTYFEFVLNFDVNLGFYPGILHAVRTLSPSANRL